MCPRFGSKSHHFPKTGSGEPHAKLTKVRRFSCRGLANRSSSGTLRPMVYVTCAPSPPTSLPRKMPLKRIYFCILARVLAGRSVYLYKNRPVLPRHASVDVNSPPSALMLVLFLFLCLRNSYAKPFYSDTANFSSERYEKLPLPLVPPPRALAAIPKMHPAPTEHGSATRQINLLSRVPKPSGSGAGRKPPRPVD